MSILILGTAVGAEPAPRVLFGDNGTYDLAAIQGKNINLAVSSGQLQFSGAAGVAERTVVFKLAPEGEDLSAWRYLEAEVVNRSTKAAMFTFWAMSGLGWGGVSTYSSTGATAGREVLAAGASVTIRIDLHARYSGKDVYTPAINPASVRWLEFVFETASDPVEFSVGAIRTVGEGLAVPAAVANRVLVPDVEVGSPAPGKRVFRQLPEYAGTQVRHALSLPAEWKTGEKYPVIVEYAGNRFFHKYCYSTGRTQDSHLAYGLARGEKFILLNLPFISTDGQREQVEGWGDIDRGVAYCLAAVADACDQFGGDSKAVVFTGFSRGYYAANYLALRTPEIAALWRAFITSGNPGAKWTAADNGWNNVGIGWDERAARLQSPWFYSAANLGAEVHADVDYLEDRPGAIATRNWLALAVSSEFQPVVADFNDCALGSLQPATNAKPGTGLGFSDTYWSTGTGLVKVVTGDLSAPVFTGYAVTQGGTPQCVQAQGVSSTTRRQQFRSLATALTGEIWCSFLTRVDNENQFSGLTFNVANSDPVNTASQGAGRIYAQGSSLLLHPWGGTAVVVPGVFPLGATALVVVRAVTSTNLLEVWVNPALPAGPTLLSTQTPAYRGTLNIVGTSKQLTIVGMGGYLGTTTAGNAGLIDSIRLGVGDAGYAHVTGLALATAPIVAAALNPEASLFAGRSLMLEVSVSGAQPFTYQWRKDGALLPGANSATLTLTGALGDNGVYDVVVTNYLGSSVSESMTVQVDTGNLLSYALGQPADLDPPELAPAMSSDRLTLTFLRARSDVVYTVQAADDFGAWGDLAVNPGVVGESVTVTDTVSLSPLQPRRFLRLKVSTP